MGRIGRFIKDAGRRRVLPTVALYIVAAWAAIQVADLAIDAGVLRWPLRNIFVAAFLGFPVALVLSWFYDVTRRGIVRTPPVGADGLLRQIAAQARLLAACIPASSLVCGQLRR